MSTLNPRYKDNPIVKHSYEFALQIIAYCEQLDGKGKYVVSKQVLRSGTSIGANIREAQNCESKNDFIHKMKIALKEADETEYWLFLCKDSNYSDPQILIEKLSEIIKILNKIISTSKLKPFAN
jgi:four helix bundle protein